VPGGPAGATGSRAKTIKISTAKISGVGTVLTTSSGLTLYRFTGDSPGTSTCTGACAKIWPPLLASKGAHVSGPRGVKDLSLLKVGDGHWQVTFHKLPLYRFEGDKKKGQAHGQNVGKVWFAVLKSGIPATAAAGAGAGATSTTAPGSSTTQPVTSTTQGGQSNSSTGANATTPTPAPTPVPQPPTPVTQPPTPVTQPTPPMTTPTTSPTTTTTAPSGGGVAF